MDAQMKKDQLEPIYKSSVQIQNVALKTSWGRRTIETGGKRGSERSMLAAWHDDDDEFSSRKDNFFQLISRCYLSI